MGVAGCPRCARGTGRCGRRGCAGLRRHALPPIPTMRVRQPQDIDGKNVSLGSYKGKVRCFLHTPGWRPSSPGLHRHSPAPLHPPPPCGRPALDPSPTLPPPPVAAGRAGGQHRVGVRLHAPVRRAAGAPGEVRAPRLHRAGLPLQPVWSPGARQVRLARGGGACPGGGAPLVVATTAACMRRTAPAPAATALPATPTPLAPADLPPTQPTPNLTASQQQQPDQEVRQVPVQRLLP